MIPRLIVVAAGIALGVLLNLAWPLTPWREEFRYSVTITATGTKNAQSGSAEVWLIKAPSAISLEKLRSTSSTFKGWEQRGEVLVSYQDQPSTIRWSGRSYSSEAFEFARHANSGIVTVEINGQSKTFDLYRADEQLGASPLVVKLADAPGAKVSRWRPWGLFLASVLLWSVVFSVAISALRSIKLMRAVAPSNGFARDALRYALPSMAIFSFVFIGTWPAQMSPDSVSQWSELVTGRFTNSHPAIQTILIGGPGFLLGSPAWSMLLQIALLALAIGGLSAEIRRWGFPSPWVWAVAILVPAMPAVHLLSTVFWKDITYTTALAVMTVCLMALVRSGGAIAHRLSFIAIYCVALFLIGTLRHNGLIVAFGLVVVVAFVLWRVLPLRFHVPAALAGAILPALFSLVLLPALGVVPLGKHYLGQIPMHILGKMLSENRISDPADLAKLHAILPTEEWKAGYDCLSVVNLFWAKGVRYDLMDGSLFRPALTSALKNPGAFLEHIVCANSLIWRMSPPANAIFSLTPLSIAKIPGLTEKLGLEERPMLLAVDRLLKQEFKYSTGSEVRFVIFWRPALMIFLLLLAMAIAAGRGNNRGIILITAPIFLSMLSMIPFSLAQDFRYQYPFYVIGIYLIVILAFSAGSGYLAKLPSTEIAMRKQGKLNGAV